MVSENRFVRLSQLHLRWKSCKAISTIVNSAMNYVKSIKSVLARTNIIFDQPLNILIQMKSLFFF